ncbi:MAG: MFS transporter [Armatimonadota bacterium]|nr:MFS transporter [bacterium]
MKNRGFSFLVPWFSDGAFALIVTAVPLLALRLGVSVLMLGTIGWVAQVARLPVTLTSGQLSEKTGRAAVIVPAACVIALCAVGIGFSRSYLQIIVLYTLITAAYGAFYPPLQALVGDVSEHGDLRKNLGAFNLGWCIGGAVCAIAARWLVRLGLPLTFFTGAAGAFVAGGLVIIWQRRRPPVPQASDLETPIKLAVSPVIEQTPPEHSHVLLFIARMGHFIGFFAAGVIRILFPKLGMSLGWSESRIATVVAMLLVGQAVAMITTGTSDWWRGKTWPQAVAQSAMMVCALVCVWANSPLALGAAFLITGLAQGVAYTAALYHGLASGAPHGKMTGIHESLVCAGYVAGNLIGGLVAQIVSQRAPYMALAALAGVSLVITTVLWRRTYIIQAHY